MITILQHLKMNFMINTLISQMENSLLLKDRVVIQKDQMEFQNYQLKT
jgi:hypothetical protein